MRKPGDTVEDFLEDGVTPSSREARQLPNKNSMMN